MTALDLPGGSGNYVSSPDHASLDITGDIDVRARIAPDDWTPAAERDIVSKSLGTGNQRSWVFAIMPTGVLRFAWSTDGSAVSTADSTVSTGLTDGSLHWVRVTRNATTGAVTFYLSGDGLTWAQLGATVSGTTGNLFNSSATMNVGARDGGTGGVYAGLIFSVEVRNGINGTVVADPRFDEQTPGASSFADSTGKTWTLNGTAVLVAGIDFTVVERNVYPPRVLLSLTGLAVTGTPDAVELYRIVGGERTAVRGGSTDAVTDSSFVRTDAELPFGVPVTWLALVNGEDEYVVGPVTYELPGGNVVISDAIGGTAAEVVILAWPEMSYDRQRTVFQVGGRNVVVSGDLAMFTGTVELYVPQTSSVENLMSVLSTLTGNVGQLRQAGGYDDIDCYFAVLSVTKRRWSQDGTDQKRTVAVEIAETESWAPALEARGFTYADLTAAYEGLTYADLSSDFATYLDLTQADLSS